MFQAAVDDPEMWGKMLAGHPSFSGGFAALLASEATFGPKGDCPEHNGIEGKAAIPAHRISDKSLLHRSD
ncbi:hypothetical protein GRI39_14035 [Altererythrobacter indicus]|uniref:Uncharacterized protein n=1 Tax=Altericroceibacterium indicum TaxID=374177 RepID=A0A845ACN1_9SPHN|nr:hypothetical protein [Altericroceibacterium indicum]MXP27149.1 hypothetical protein [Altericroceibacterium indicum]